MQDKKFLVTGATGQIAFYIAKNLAAANTVHAIARFSAEGSRDRLEQAGVRCIKLDFASGYRQINSLETEESRFRFQATAKLHSENALILRSR